MNHISIDLETLGTTAGHVILSIGARRFDPITGETFDSFYANLDRLEQESLGMSVNPATEQWWFEQSPEAQERLLVDVESPYEGLMRFVHWCGNVDGAWGWGSNFDIVLIESLFDLYAAKTPWRYWNIRCGRTICALVDIKPARLEGHHQADMDATVQAEAIIAAYKKLGLCKQGDLF